MRKKKSFCEGRHDGALGAGASRETVCGLDSLQPPAVPGCIQFYRCYFHLTLYPTISKMVYGGHRQYWLRDISGGAVVCNLVPYLVDMETAFKFPL